MDRFLRASVMEGSSSISTWIGSGSKKMCIRDRYETPDTEFFTKPGDYVFWKRGTCQYRYSDGCAFVLNGGFYAHHYGATMRGSCGASPQCFTIVTTGFTPVEQVLSLSVE